MKWKMKWGVFYVWVQLGGKGWGGGDLPFRSGEALTLIVLVILGPLNAMSHFFSKARILSPFSTTIIVLLQDRKVSELWFHTPTPNGP